MNKKVILGGIAIAAFVLAPIGIKKMIDNSIDLKKSELNKVGVLLSIDNSEGYLKTTRDFTITIKDETKFKKYFKNILSEKYPVYEMILSRFEQNNGESLDEFLKGVVFKGNINNSNISPSSEISVYTYLDKLSENIMTEIKNDAESSKIILPLFEKEAFAFNMVFDSDTKLKTLALKDIDENIKTTSKYGNTTEGIFQILGNKVINNSTEKEIVSNIKFDKINMDVKSKKNANFNINNLKFNINYENKFINNSKTEIGSINLDVDTNKNLSLGNTKIASGGVVSNGVYSANSKIFTKNFKLVDGNKNVNLDSLNLNLYLNDLDYKNLQNLNKAYMNFESTNIESMSLPRNERMAQLEKVQGPLLLEVNSFLNNGLSLKLDTDLTGLKTEELKLKNLKLKIDAKLDKNNLNIQTINQFVILSLLDVKANIEMLEEDYINLISIFNPNLTQVVSMYAKRENGKVLFDLDLKKGKIEVNGQKVN